MVVIFPWLLNLTKQSILDSAHTHLSCCFNQVYFNASLYWYKHFVLLLQLEMEIRRNIESTNTNWCTLAVRCSGQIDLNVNVAWPVYGYLPLCIILPLCLCCVLLECRKI